MPLSRTQIENAKPREKPLKLFDGRGLYLEIAPSGARWWRYKYRIANKEKRISLGVYPDVGLKDARERLDAARKLVAAGIDPSEQRKAQKLATIARVEHTFEAIAREWFELNKPKWVEAHSSKIIGRLERDVFPWLGKRPIEEITAAELLAVLRRIEARGAIESTHRANQNCGQVFRYAIATGRCKHNITADLRGALAPKVPEHMASIKEPAAIGELLRAIDGYHGSLITRCALQLAPLVFVRPGELRQAEWCEFNFEAAEWRIPPEHMKKRQLHVVPLSRQAIAIMRELQPLTGDGRFVFPSERTRLRPMSNNTVNAGLRRLGYTNDEMTGHGFRSMASTLLNEQGWHPDAIERQLAHAEPNETRAAYNYAKHLPERRRMMQAWSDYLDGLKSGRSSHEVAEQAAAMSTRVGVAQAQ
ncbi:MAG: integrase arm-type DNA-binding domain-containing protein [Gammaproteobacteria bacterium]